MRRSFAGFGTTGSFFSGTAGDVQQAELQERSTAVSPQQHKGAGLSEHPAAATDGHGRANIAAIAPNKTMAATTRRQVDDE